MKKIDLHVHAGLKKMSAGLPDPQNESDNYLGDAQEVRAHLEEQNIAHAVLMSGGEKGGAMSIQNDVCRAIAQGAPEFYSWMCNLDPVDPDTVLERLRRYKEQGAVGVGELAINEWMDSPMLTAVFAAAEKLGMPVTIHMSPEQGYAYGVCDRPGLPLLEQTLRRFPGLKLLGHSQVFWLEISADCPREGNKERSQRGHGPVVPGGRVPELFEKYPNLYGDLSAGSASCAILRDEEFGLAFLERYADRLFFATDTVNRHQTFPLGAFLDRACADGRLSRTAYEKICAGNAKRVFGL